MDKTGPILDKTGPILDKTGPILDNIRRTESDNTAEPSQNNRVIELYVGFDY